MKLRSDTTRKPFGDVDQNEMRDGSDEEHIDSDGPDASAPVSAPRRDAVPPPRKRSRPPDDAEEANTPGDEANRFIDTLMNSRDAPASMDKLKDNDNNQVVVFHRLGALAVDQMNAIRDSSAAPASSQEARRASRRDLGALECSVLPGGRRTEAEVCSVVDAASRRR